MQDAAPHQVRVQAAGSGLFQHGKPFVGVNRNGPEGGLPDRESPERVAQGQRRQQQRGGGLEPASGAPGGLHPGKGGGAGDAAAQGAGAQQCRIVPDELPVGMEGRDAQHAEGSRPQGIGALVFPRQLEHAPEPGKEEQDQQGQHQPQPGIAVVAGGLRVLMVGEIGEAGPGKKLRGKVGEHPAAVAEPWGLVRQRPRQFGQVQTAPEGKRIQQGGQLSGSVGQVQHGISRSQEEKQNEQDGRRIKFPVIAENAGGINEKAQGDASQRIRKGGAGTAGEGNENERQPREQADAPFPGGSHAVRAEEKSRDGQEMSGKILVPEEPDVAQLRSEQGIIRPEPGGLRTRHVLVPPQQGVQQSQRRRQHGKNAPFPIPGSGIRPRHEHGHGRDDEAQVRHSLIVKPG